MGPSSLNNSQEQAPQVVVADADPQRRAEFKTLFEGAGFQVCITDSEESCSKALARYAALVVVVDSALAGDDGIHGLCKRLRGAMTVIETPIILSFDPATDFDVARNALLGVADFLQQPVHPGLALMRVKAVIKRSQASAVQAKQPSAGAGLGVEREFCTETELVSKINQHLPHVNGQGHSLAVLHIKISEMVGSRQWGDLQPFVREQLVRSIKGNLLGALDEFLDDRSSGLAVHSVAQVGEHSFLVCLNDVRGVQDAARVAYRMQERLSVPTVIEETSARLSAWIGIALAPQDGVQAEDLLRFAERAMHRAREKAGKGVEYYTEAMGRWSFERLMLEASLSQAIERNELRVFYQPRVDARTRRIKGMEALVRWMHPDLGMVSPAQFIPIAEESGLIVPIGAWVMHEACRQNQAWREMGLPHIRVSVNLSSVQFAKTSVSELVSEALSRSKLGSDGLEVELTESILMEDPLQSIETLREIKRAGVHISIDDFGTGYSSLAYLKRFPLDALKIDRAFVDEVTSNADDAAIATAIILMGHSLKLEVVAEGVETLSQLDFLNVLQCDEVQGFYFSPPVPPDKAELLLRGHDHRMAA